MVCRRCTQERGDDFYPGERVCRPCRKAAMRARGATPEAKARRSERRAERGEEALAVRRAWREANPEKVKAHKRNGLASQRARRSTDEGRRANAAAARARRLGRDRVALEYAEIIRRDPCSYCGAPPASEVDHIDPVVKGGANSWDNLTAACRECNSHKRDRPLLEAL